jgi:hypothetical protein
MLYHICFSTLIKSGHHKDPRNAGWTETQWAISVSGLYGQCLLGENMCKYYAQSTEALLLDSVEGGIEVNAEKLKYMFTSHEQNSGQNHNTNIATKSFGKVAKFHYFRMSLTKKNSKDKDITSKLN